MGHIAALRGEFGSGSSELPTDSALPTADLSQVAAPSRLTFLAGLD